MYSLNHKLKSLFPSREGEKSASGIKRITLPKIVKYDKREKITLEYLKRILYYHANSGDWIWLEDRPLGAYVKQGSRAGTINGKGYIQIGIDGSIYQAHILAWFYETGEWPLDEIDHINTISYDNAWSNLREASHAQNKANVNKFSSNSSGFKGVCWDKRRKKYVVHICVEGDQKHLGYFKDIIIAARTYDRAAIKYHREFARLNFPLEDYLNE